MTKILKCDDFFKTFFYFVLYFFLAKIYLNILLFFHFMFMLNSYIERKKKTLMCISVKLYM